MLSSVNCAALVCFFNVSFFNLSYLSLPLSRFVEKMVKKWIEKDPYVSSYQTSPTFNPPPRPLYNQTPMLSSNQPQRSSLAISHSSQPQRPFFDETLPVLNQNRPSNSKNCGSHRNFYPSYPGQQIDRASSTVSDLCRVHQRRGDSPWSCEGHPCKMAHLNFLRHIKLKVLLTVSINQIPLESQMKVTIT